MQTQAYFVRANPLAEHNSTIAPKVHLSQAFDFISALTVTVVRVLDFVGSAPLRAYGKGYAMTTCKSFVSQALTFCMLAGCETATSMIPKSVSDMMPSFS